MSRTRGSSRRAIVGVSAVLMAVPLTIAAEIAEPERRAEALTINQLTIQLDADDFTVLGGDEDRVLSVMGDVHWRNRSGRTLTVTSPDGLLDSGPIPDGGSFHASLPVAGTWTWESEVGSDTIVVEAELTGDLDDPANESIPDLAPPPRDSADIGLHPDLLVELSRTIAIVGFTEDATVQNANAALGNDWDIVGGLPEAGLLYVKAYTSRRPTDFVVLDNRLENLRNNQFVEFASYDFIDDDITITVTPDDAADIGQDGWFWEPPQVDSIGTNDNWGLELARVPQAWNLKDATRLDGGQGRSTTVAVDSGFEDHEDLDRLQRIRACATGFVGLDDSGKCTTTEPSDHGNEIAGIIGADHDDVGVSGVDPYSNLVGLPWVFDVPGERKGDTNTAMTLLLRAIRDGVVPDVAVVNMSFGLRLPPASVWWERHGDETCGPGPDDDDGATGVCYPDTHDKTLEGWEQGGRAARRLIEGFVRILPDPPLFVVATGNDSLYYCESQAAPVCPLGTGHKVAKSTGPLWAEANWRDEVLDNPIITVESIGELTDFGPPRAGAPSLDRSGYSNIGGNVSASGMTVSTESSAGSACGTGDGTNGYCYSVGTSLSAPLVAGVAGLLSSWDSGLTANDLKRIIETWAIADTGDGAAPRVDAFASLLSLPGAARALVDVNDPSADGNRRVEYEPDGGFSYDLITSTTDGFLTEPDGSVDLRDFRRFRDAWLLRCSISPEAGCPDTADIALDGIDQHPKFDLNGDGCIERSAPGPAQACPSELTFPRFDFNGDGTISLTDEATVPLRQNGEPASDPASARPMSDLAVLQSQWDDGAPGALGVTAGDLPDLMTSGDLVMLTDGLVPTGAASAQVVVVDEHTDEPIGTYDVTIGGDDDPVITVRSGTPYRIEMSATGTGGDCSLVLGPLDVDPGEDRPVDLSAALAIVADPPDLRPGESGEIVVSAASCNGSVTGAEAVLAVDPVLPNGATLASTTVTLDADGRATTTLEAGDLRGRYDITATAELPIGPTATSQRSDSTSATVGEFYELEVAAVDGPSSGYVAIDEYLDLNNPVGPSVNGHGEVAFGALPTGGGWYGVYVAGPGDDPTLPSAADEVSGDVIPDDVDGRIIGEPQLNDAGQVAFTAIWSVENGVTYTVNRSNGVGDATQLARAVTLLAGEDTPYVRVGQPTINESGRTVFVAVDPSGSQFLAESAAGLTVVGAEYFGADPEIADDDTVVVEATISRACADYPGVCTPGFPAILDDLILVEQGLHPNGGIVLAEVRTAGWEGLTAPDISPPGDAVAFGGQRNGEISLWVATRRANGDWQEPVEVEGPGADVGELVDLTDDQPTITQIERAPAGPGGDRLLIAVRGTASGSDAPAAEGVHIVTVDLVENADGTITPVTVGTELVAQVGDVIDGRAIARIELSDAIALAATPEFPDDHWVAFYAETPEETNMFVRARALSRPDTPAAASVPTGPGTGMRVAGGAPSTLTDTLPMPISSSTPSQRTPAEAPHQADPPFDPDDVVIVDGPHVAAVTVFDDTPNAREPSTIVNRSRALDGSPAWAVVDENTSNPDVLPNPETLMPDEQSDLVYPRAGTERLLLGAPLSSGEFANDVGFQVTVGLGENRPPVGDLDGPYLVAPGQSLSVLADGNDPDGDRLSYEWDFDDDGVFDDHVNAFPNQTLTAEQVQTVVCGGSCVLDQPYPIAVRIVDDRGLSTEVSSAVTVSGLGDLVLRLDPTLVQANPGSTAIAYVFVDKPAGDVSIPVELAIENAPPDWNISVADDTTSGSSELVVVRVPDDADEGSFTADIVARAGDVELRTTLTIVTQFGLIPECTATLRGTVTDENGDPIEGAVVDPSLFYIADGITDGNGDFETSFTLPQGSSVVQFSWRAAGPGDPLYVESRGGPLYAYCDEVTEFNPVLPVPAIAGGISARAVEGVENPVYPTRPLATDIPMQGIGFELRYRPGLGTVTVPSTTGADGTVFYPSLPTENMFGNDVSYQLVAFKDGYWSVTRNVTLSQLDEGQTIDLGDFPMVEACTGTVTGGTVVDQFGDPVGNALVRILNTNIDPISTEADGTFSFDRELSLGTFNRPRLVSIQAFSPNEWEGNDVDTDSQQLGSCDATTDPFELELERPEPEVDYFATLLGTVTDDDTGQPLAGVAVSGGAGARLFSTQTDANGDWQAEVLVGTDPADVWGYNVAFRLDQTHWRRFVPTQVPVDGEARVDTTMIPKVFVTLSGTITDAYTGEPVEGARLFPGDGTVFTAADGTYAIPDLQLEEGREPAPPFDDGAPYNGPREVGVGASFNHLSPSVPRPYWPVSTTTTLTEEGPNELNLRMIPLCDSASVSGLVLNAATLEPLEGVDISAGGRSTQTNAEGRYSITDILPGTDNEPRDVTVFARKEGFFDNRIDITTFCGAQLIVDFGTPVGGFGTVSGTVTEVDSGDPLSNVFVGTTWGDSAVTGADGTYSFDRAPLTADGDPRDWVVSARLGSEQQDQQVTVSADQPATADFQFAFTDQPPTADDQALSTDPESALSITLTGDDVEGADLTFEIVDEPTLGTLAGIPPDLEYTPNGTTGNDSFTFTVSDGNTVSEPATVTIEIADDPNAPPAISVPSSVTAKAGEPFDFAVTANDPDLDPMTFSLVADGEGLAELVDHGDGTATITITSAPGDVGRSVSVTVGVSDGELGDSGTTEVAIVAPSEPVNRSPEPDIDAPAEVVEGVTITFDGRGSSDPDGDALTFTWTLVDFDGATVESGAGPTWSVPFDDDFLGAIRLLLTDARGETALIEQEVLVTNAPPELDVEVDGSPPQPERFGADGRPIEIVEIEPGGAIGLAGAFTDPGTADTHTVTVDWGDGATEAIEHTAGSFGAGHSYPTVGTYDVRVEVCDDDGGCTSGGDQVAVVAPDSASPTPEPVATLPPTGAGDTSRTTAGVAVVSMLIGWVLVAIGRRRPRRNHPPGAG